MKKKRMATAILTAAMVLSAVPTAFAADNITVTVDGQKVIFEDQQPVNINGRVMVPVRAVAEKMGWEVSFEKFPGNTVVDGKFQEESHAFMVKNVDEIASVSRSFGYLTNITIEKGTIISGSNAGYGDEKALVAKPVVQNGRTLLGIRDIAEGLYANVEWDGATKTVAITTKPVEQFPDYDKLTAYIADYRKMLDETSVEEEIEKKQEQEKTVEVDSSQYAEEILRLVNEEREKVGVDPLELDDTLTKAANIRAEEITKVFDHTRPNGESYRSLLEEMGVDISCTGENINGGSFDKPSSAMELWMSSKGHRQNILNPDFNYIGVGYVIESESNGVFDDATSRWVQIFRK